MRDEKFRLSDIEAGPRRGRYRLYWISSLFSTFVFSLVLFVIFTVPGVPKLQKLSMYAAAGLFLALSLVVGIWRFESTEAPITFWPAGTLTGVFLGAELAVCVVGLIQVALATNIP